MRFLGNVASDRSVDEASCLSCEGIDCGAGNPEESKGTPNTVVVSRWGCRSMQKLPIRSLVSAVVFPGFMLVQLHHALWTVMYTHVLKFSNH